ncbi:MAG: FxsA family protein [Thermoguttaceae bacterium]
MLYTLFVIFVAMPILEIAILWALASSIGWANVAFLVLGTGAIGVLLARREWFSCLQKLHAQLDRGEQPTETVVEGVLIFVAGLLLVVPGLLTDLIGILLLIPPMRRYAMRYAVRRFMVHRQKMQTAQSASATTVDDVIDVD